MQSFSFPRARATVAALTLAAVHSLAFADQPATADDELQRIVISATRLPTPQAEVASSVTVITSDDIELKQARTLPDVLADVPGLNIVQTGGPGGLTSLFIRGTNSNHVKILIDGVDASDPSNPSDVFNLSQLLLSDVERIEVLRGPQSGLYGSDAIGGAIYIVTKSGEGPPQLTTRVEGGSLGTFNQAAAFSGSTDTTHYAFNVEHFRATDTPVTPLELLPAGQERINDSYDNTSFSTKLGTQLSRDLSVDLVARYIDATLDFTGDNPNLFPSVPDPTQSEYDTQQLFTRAAAHWSLFEGRFDQTLGIGYTHDHSRDIGPETGTADNSGNRLKADWQGNITVATGEIVTVGAEHQRDAIQESPISAQTTTNAGFVQLQSSIDSRLFNTVSLRYDDNDRFGGKTTFRLAPEYVFSQTGTTFRGSIGTGFKAPTLDQLFVNFPAFDFFANPNLKPESSTGYDFGFEQALAAAQLRFGATYFHNRIRDLIDSNASSTSYANVDKASTHGLESFIAWTPLQALALRADYTYTIADDDILHEELLRRPKNKASLNATWRASAAWTLSATMLYVGSWIDDNRSFSIPRLEAAGYATTDIAATFALSHRVSLFGRLTNLFDRRYENPVGFDHPGFGAIAGIKAEF